MLENLQTGPWINSLSLYIYIYSANMHTKNNMKTTQAKINLPIKMALKSHDRDFLCDTFLSVIF